MKSSKFYLQMVSLLMLTLLSTACSIITGKLEETIEPDNVGIGMANPAAVYCEGLGYTLEDVERDGGMDADCLFPDGSRCGQWDFLSGRCGQEFTFCELHDGMIEESSNIGTCRFTDSSTCDEYQYFLGDCSPGDHPGETSDGVLPAKENAYLDDEEAFEIHSFIEARDYLAAYFDNQYGIEPTEPWMEENITPEDAGPKSTYRFVSGPLTIVMTADASAPFASIYAIDEASYLVNGFYWEGSLGFDGTIEEVTVYPPGTILNEKQARDAVMAHLAQTYDLTQAGEWIDSSTTHTEEATLIRVYTSNNWVVEVRFEPAAPLVSSYAVTVDNLSKVLRWEGEITLRGEIEEISFTQ